MQQHLRNVFGLHEGDDDEESEVVPNEENDRRETDRLVEAVGTDSRAVDAIRRDAELRRTLREMGLV